MEFYITVRTETDCLIVESEIIVSATDIQEARLKAHDHYQAKRQQYEILNVVSYLPGMYNGPRVYSK